MATITASVGRDGKNRLDDVRCVQDLLNQHRLPSQTPVRSDGSMNAEIIAAIEEFQKRVVNLAHPDGRVDPDGKTFKALLAGQPPTLPVSPKRANLSGATWWHANEALFPNSHRIEDLEPNFRAKVQEFLAALKTAGAILNVSATLRNKQRVYLIHYSFRIAHDSIDPQKSRLSPVSISCGITVTQGSRKQALKKWWIFLGLSVSDLATRTIGKRQSELYPRILTGECDGCGEGQMASGTESSPSLGFESG